MGAVLQSGRTVEALSELIGAIYDCALDPGRWQALLERLNHEFRFSSSIVGIVPLASPEQIVNVSVGFDDEWLSHMHTYTADSVDLWGGSEYLNQVPLDEPIVASQTSGFAQRFQNRYFAEVLQPRGLTDGVAIAVARESSLVGYVAFNRHGSAGKITRMEIEALRFLGPHFRRAVTISNMLDLRAVEAATFTAALGAVTSGVVLVDGDLAIVHANPRAEAMLATGDPIHAIQGTLGIQPENSQAALVAAVRQADIDKASLGQRGIGIPVRHKSGEPGVIHVLPLSTRELRPGLEQRAVAALFIASTAASTGTATNALALLYDLTPAEARVFELVCAGKSVKAIAQQLGIAGSTIKTHLVRVFQKTGCRRQVDLVKLAAGLSLPL